MHRNRTASRSLIAIFSVALGCAQTATPPTFFRVDFIKTKPGKATEYTDFLKKNLPAITQAQIKAGKLLSWGYSQVFTPTGEAQEHNALGLYGYSSWGQMEPSDGPPDYITSTMKTLGFTSPKDYAEKRNPMRDIVRTEIWRRQAGTTPTPDTTPKAGEWVIVSYLKTLPGKGGDYDTIWKNYSLPIQEARVKDGKLKSYSMWATFGGNSSEANYNRVSLARYASFKDLGPAEGGMAETDAAAERIHPGKDWRQMRRDMVALRTIYRTEIIQIKMTER
jgi:hypothetical protein